ncbi:MAG: endolytic transglycosylase MltG [Candidatus Berkelbacteria bacterium]|nr:MAG: endolytic transglycosylase MltG [Candidatus Berkelbacteria bacterium]QQG51881.1 MAG: endolytic transglycosylase MltG [Candidatus Berkelbacteria bacterium]
MRLLKIIAVILFVGVAVIAAIFISSLGAANANSSENKEFLITAGESTTDISQRLEKVGLVKNGFAFYVYMKLIGGKLLPGTYEFSPSQSATQIGWLLGSGRYKTAKITIIEGWRVTQMAEYFAEEKKLKNVDDFAQKAVQYEGYLFPDTYEIKVDATSDEIIELMRDNFTKKTAGLKLTPETVILASIVEREAQSEGDRAPIAGVYSNRIKKGMRLEADPTVQYAKGSWKIITREDYRSVTSPYNTYLNDGFPPSPIASPGLASLKAAAEPEVHEYLYFFHAKGQTYFSKTLAEHSAKVAQYL